MLQLLVCGTGAIVLRVRNELDESDGRGCQGLLVEEMVVSLRAMMLQRMLMQMLLRMMLMVMIVCRRGRSVRVRSHKSARVVALQYKDLKSINEPQDQEAGHHPLETELLEGLPEHDARSGGSGRTGDTRDTSGGDERTELQ